MPEGLLQARQGSVSRRIAQGESPGENGPTPLLFPLPSLAGEGPHRIRRLTGLIMTPGGSRAEFFNELPAQDTRSCFKTSSILLQRGLSTRQEPVLPPRQGLTAGRRVLPGGELIE